MAYFIPILAFLAGSIPFGLLIGKACGKDIRQFGSGNIGATNVFRVVGKPQGLLCFVLDVLKGFLPVLLAVNILRFQGGKGLMLLPYFDSLAIIHPEDARHFIQTLHVLTAVLAILGHNYSPWLRGKGGKGIATSLGAIIALMPVAAVTVLLLWVITLLISRYVSVASVVASFALPLIVLYGSYYHGKLADGTWNRALLTLTIVTAFLAFWRHRGNLARLREGTEPRIGQEKS